MRRFVKLYFYLLVPMCLAPSCEKSGSSIPTATVTAKANNAGFPVLVTDFGEWELPSGKVIVTLHDQETPPMMEILMTPITPDEIQLQERSLLGAPDRILSAKNKNASVKFNYASGWFMLAKDWHSFDYGFMAGDKWINRASRNGVSCKIATLPSAEADSVRKRVQDILEGGNPGGITVFPTREPFSSQPR